MSQSGSKIRSWLALGVVLVAIGALPLLTSCGGAIPRRDTQVVDGDPGLGAEAIQRYGCGSCHTIPGLRLATGVVGPPLDFWADRWYIAGRLVNRPANLVTWLTMPQTVDPGQAMPDMGVSAEEAEDMAAYLYTLRRGGRQMPVTIRGWTLRP